MAGGKNGGTIYQRELGWFVSAAQGASGFGHLELSALLIERRPAEDKLLSACWLHERELVRSLPYPAGLPAALKAPGSCGPES